MNLWTVPILALASFIWVKQSAHLQREKKIMLVLSAYLNIMTRVPWCAKTTVLAAPTTDSSFRKKCYGAQHKELSSSLKDPRLSKGCHSQTSDF